MAARSCWMAISSGRQGVRRDVPRPQNTMFHGIQKRPKWASENRPKWRPKWRGVRCVRNGRPPLRGTPIISDGNFGPSERPNWPLVEGHPMTGYLDRLIAARSEEHTSELQSLMRISYAVFCLKQTTKHTY